MTTLSLTYLLADTALFGGTKVALHQANLMVRRGHRVTVVSTGERPDWFPLEAELLTVERLEPGAIPPADLCVATFWTTLQVAVEAPCRQAVHYCQGYEGSFDHNRAEHPAIESAYRLPVPAMVVSPHLARFLEQRFDRSARWVPQPLERFWHSGRRPGRWLHTLRRRPHRRPRVLVSSPFEIEWKGVETALRAVRTLRERSFDVHLVRLSQWPIPDQERALLAPDEAHQRLLPRQVARLMAGCDLLLAPSWEQEGFGLPVLEAMACGVPVVASDVSCFRDYAASAALLVPWDRPEAFADAAEEALSSPRTWRRMRRAGWEVAGRFTEERSARAAEEAFRWALAGAPKASEGASSSPRL